MQEKPKRLYKLQVYVDESLHAELEEEALNQDRSVSSVALRRLRSSLRESRRKAGKNKEVFA